MADRSSALIVPPNAAVQDLQLYQTSTKGKVPTGYAEEIAISESAFRAQHRTVQSQQSAGKKRKREGKGESSVVYGKSSYKGPWARFEERDLESDSGEEIEVEVDEGDGGSGNEEVVYEEDAIAPMPTKGTLAGTSYEDTAKMERESSTFEGSEMYDYQGRTYMHVPQDLNVDLTSDFESLSLKCYTPKKVVHTFKTSQGKNAHEKAITGLRWFPGSGHLLLSSGADGKVRLWDGYHDHEHLRTYSGHNKSVVDVDFSPDGTRFLTASYDRQMKVWDTETGACSARFSTGSTPHVVRWHPDPASSPSGGEFLAGMHDNKIVQFDIRTPQPDDPDSMAVTKYGGGDKDRSKPVQEYDHHLGPINTLTFFDNNRRFLSTSDDKSVRAWEFNIPVPIKFIADPEMFPLVRSCPHPKGQYVLYQSADNKIAVYSAGDKVRVNRKKEFRGHNVAGYAVEVGVSPDGGVVCSGSTGGEVCFWDWKTGRLWQKLRAGESPIVSVTWQPRESSKVVTGDLNGVIKYWD